MQQLFFRWYPFVRKRPLRQRLHVSCRFYDLSAGIPAGKRGISARMPYTSMDQAVMFDEWGNVPWDWGTHVPDRKNHSPHMFCTGHIVLVRVISYTQNYRWILEIPAGSVCNSFFILPSRSPEKPESIQSCLRFIGLLILVSNESVSAIVSAFPILRIFQLVPPIPSW